jgi:hypothetical protein
MLRVEGSIFGVPLQPVPKVIQAFRLSPFVFISALVKKGSMFWSADSCRAVPSTLNFQPSTDFSTAKPIAPNRPAFLPLRLDRGE